MNARVFIFGILFFLLPLAAHLIIWRLKRPRHQIKVLLLVFISLPAAAAAMTSCLAGWTFLDICQVLLMAYALSGLYVLSYPAAQAISPSLKLLLIIGENARGIPLKELVLRFTGRELFDERLVDLVNESLIIDRGGSFELTRQGRMLVLPFILMRTFLGIPAGRG